MNYLCKKILIWIGEHFPFIPRVFGLKVLRVGYTDITPDPCCGRRPEGGVESKVSWLVENLSEEPLSVKIIISCVQADDGWIQAYPVNQALQGGWNKDIPCGEEKFDLASREKVTETILPTKGFLKVDHFASQEPHPFCSSSLSFQIVPADKSVIVLQRDFLNLKTVGIYRWIAPVLLIVSGLFLALFLLGYFWVRFGDPVWKHFFR